MRIRVTLKKAYTWIGQDPEKPKSNNYGFIQTDHLPKMGGEITFEALCPSSLAGDLNTDHYKYFNGRTFKLLKGPTKHIPIELIEA